MNLVAFTNSRCPSADQLTRFAEGELEEPVTERIATHLESCPTCRTALAELEMVLLQNPFLCTLRQVVADTPQEDSFQSSWGRVIANPGLVPKSSQDTVSLSSHDSDLQTDVVSAQDQRNERDQRKSAGHRLAYLTSQELTKRQLYHRLIKLPEHFGGGMRSTSDGEALSLAAKVDSDWIAIFTPTRGEGELGWLGPFRVERLLGQGEIEWVFLAEDTRQSISVALKLIQPPFASEPTCVAAFQRLGQTLRSVQSAYVVRVYEVGELETRLGTLPYLMMEYLSGETLADRLQRRPIPLEELYRLGRQVLLGLDAVHHAGLQHLDLQPNRIWLESLAPSDEVTRACLLDFGLAQLSSEPQLTQTSQTPGSPVYMSPEQASGKETDHRSDLFSLGTVLYEMATGQQPFRRPSRSAELVAVTREMPLLPHRLNPEIPTLLSRFIERCLAKKPNQRFADTQAALAAWDALIRNAQPQRSSLPVGLKGMLSSSGPFRWQLSDRFRRQCIAGCMLLLLLAAGWAGWLIQIETRSGTLRIEAPADSGPIRILQDGKPILERTLDKKIKLIEGDYQIELVDPSDSIKLTPHELTLQRGQEQVIRVWREKLGGTTEPERDDGAERAGSEKNSSLAQSALPRNQDGEGQSGQPSVGARVRSVDQVESKPEHPADASRAGLPPAPLAPPTPEPRAVARSGKTWGAGNARVEGDELVLESPDGLFQLQFGDPNWSEYDFQVECRQDEGNGNLFICYRCVDGQNRRQLSLGSFQNQYLGVDLWVDGKWSGLIGERWSLARDRWHTVRVAVRDEYTDLFLDGERRLTERSPIHPRGMVGLAVHRGRARFRQIRVTAPGGELLWEGMPQGVQTDSGAEVSEP